jgi:hypothetical protein
MTFKSLMLAVVAGAFGADLALSPVPQPQVWSMLLAGLGIYSTLAWRRQQPARVRVRVRGRRR